MEVRKGYVFLREESCALYRCVVAGSNRHILCLNSGMTVTGGDGYGVGICPLDLPLVSLGEPGLWKYSLDYVPCKANVYVSLFNNQWSTNFPLWVEGAWSSRVRLWVVRKSNDEAALITPSWDARVACPAAYFDGPAQTLPVSQEGLGLSRKGVLVTAFGPNPFGEGLVLRLWEQAGQRGDCQVRLPEPLKGATVKSCNLRGEPATDLPAGNVPIPLEPFAPATRVLSGNLFR